MLLIIPSAVVSSHVRLAVLSYLTLPSHVRRARLGAGLQG